MKNSMLDVHNMLVATMEELCQEDLSPDQLDNVAKRADATVKVGNAIVGNARVVAVKRKYRLTVDRREAEALDRTLRRWASTRMEFTAPGRAGQGSSVSPITPRSLPVARPDALGRYDNNRDGRIACAEARRHGIAPSAADIPPTASCTTAKPTESSANSPNPPRSGLVIPDPTLRLRGKQPEGAVGG